MPPQSPSLHLLPPPGPSVLLLSAGASPKGTIPPIFLAAHKVRLEVFVTEQHCSAANEIDADDATSWHWVIYAPSPPPPHGENDRAWLDSLGKSPEESHHFNNNNNNSYRNEGELVSVIPAGTIRLVPLPPPAEDYNKNGQSAAPPSWEGVAEPAHRPTKMWDGKEAYIKLGRLATVRSHRGLGIGKLLVDAALKWALENAATLQRQPSGTRAGENLVGENTAEGEEENGWNGLVLVHAQRDVERFYRGVGFETDDGMGVWTEEGIDHVGMWRRLDLGDVQL